MIWVKIKITYNKIKILETLAIKMERKDKKNKK
jgi:hypothetical protein